MSATSAPSPSTTTAPAPSSGMVRAFGRFELRQLLGKSQRSMVWLAFDTSIGQELMLTMPRAQPADEPALQHWLRAARAAARLDHPHLAAVGEVAVHEHWPYVAVDRALGLTLAEWLLLHPKPTPAEVADWIVQVLQGLAFAHDAGITHGDVQTHTVLINDQGVVRLMALAAFGERAETEPTAYHLQRSLERVQAEEGDRLREKRDAAQRDVATTGVLLHGLLAGQPGLDEPDTSRVLARMHPQGHEVLRLPWTTPYPIAEALRAIANRATTSHAQQRYLSARTLLRALQGWSVTDDEDAGGPLALLLDRLRTVGHLPALPGVSARVERLAAMDGFHVDEIAEHILKDMALSLELLRQVNSAQVQAGQVPGGPPVLTIRRAIAMLGLNGVRSAANALRRWPGPLSEAGALALQKAMDRARLAGHTAQALRPPGYDGEVMYLVSLLQNLGRLLVQYHFPDEAEQIRVLMQVPQVVPGAESDTPKPAGLTLAQASYGVLGVDIEAVGPAVARHWGLGEEMVHMIRRVSRDSPVRTPDTDADVLRLVASLADEAVDALDAVQAPRVAQALTAAAQRYARALNVSARDLQAALQAGQAALKGGGKPAAAQAATAATAAAAAPGAAAPAAGASPVPSSPGTTAAAAEPHPAGRLRDRLRAASSGDAARPAP